jgi:tetratricopeptide (TPR) repeat protein
LDYFTDSDTELTYSVRRMPYQLSKYVIDLQRPEKDLEWAQGKYSGEGNIGRLYERIWKEKYDRDAFYRGEPAEIEAHANTLENIYEYGGVCTHAAQFATGVGKAVGVPCVTITGASQGGIGHAWVGFVRTGGPARLQWDVNSGRIGDNDAYVGHVRDPHTGQTYAEHELNLAVLAMATSESKRLRADVWRGVSELLARNGQGAQAEWAMEQSLDTAVYDKAQWQAYAALAQRGTVKGEDALNTAEALVEKLEDWPGLAVDAFSAIILADRTMDADKKVEEIDDMAGEFRRNEYAQARAVILKGTVLELAGEQARAVETYEEGVEDLLDTSLGLRVLDHAGRLYVDMGKLEEAIDLHEDAWDKADRPTRTHAYIRYTTWFQIGQRLAALHALAGEPDDQEETIERMVRLTDADGDEADFLEGQLAKVGYHAVNTTRAPQGVQ